MKSPNQTMPLVFSTAPSLNEKCLKCRELKLGCVCRPEDNGDTQTIVANIRIEKKGRAGKIVTVIDRLPRNEIFLKELTSKLKKKCGAGGTYVMSAIYGMIEIQGDKRVVVRDVLEKEGIKYKG